MAAEDITSLDTIRDLRRREPFVPFTVVMTSGDRYVIENGDALASRRRSFTTIRHDPSGRFTCG